MELKGFVDNGGLCELGVVAAGAEEIIGVRGAGLVKLKTQDSRQ